VQSLSSLLLLLLVEFGFVGDHFLFSGVVATSSCSGVSGYMCTGSAVHPTFMSDVSTCTVPHPDRQDNDTIEPQLTQIHD
jgi:hypothetical protein